MDKPMKMEFVLPQTVTNQLHQLMFNTAKQAFIEAAEVQKFPEYMTKREAAKYLHVSDQTLSEFIRLGLDITVINNIQRISRTAADEFMKQHQI